MFFMKKNIFWHLFIQNLFSTQKILNTWLKSILNCAKIKVV
jgi:hypothetical protein